jgi:hypothetical protein
MTARPPGTIRLTQSLSADIHQGFSGAADGRTPLCLIGPFLALLQLQ